MVRRPREFAFLTLAGAGCLGLAASCSAVNEPDPPTGGSGGTAGTTSTGVGGEGGAYAQAGFADSTDDELRYRSAPFEPETYDGRFMAVDFAWAERATRPTAFDLSVELVGMMDPLAQVFTSGGKPFARMGVAVARLHANASYRVEATRTAEAVWARIVRNDDGEIVLSGDVVELPESAGATLLFVTPKSSPQVSLGSPTILD